MNPIHIPDIQKIALSYQENFKPLLEIIKVRNHNKYPKNCLNEIRAINDHIARCYQDEITDDQIIKNIGKAEGHLQRLGYDCYKQLIMYQVADIRYTVRHYYSSYWLYIGDGNLWKAYLTSYKTACKYEKEAKHFESINPDQALNAYDQAFNKYQEISNIFTTYKYQIRVSRYMQIFKFITHWIWWLALTAILSIISAIIGHFIRIAFNA